MQFSEEDFGLDLGAGFGDSSIIMGLFLNKVICIEPIPNSFEILKENTKNNGNQHESLNIKDILFPRK